MRETAPWFHNQSMVRFTDVHQLDRALPNNTTLRIVADMKHHYLHSVLGIGDGQTSAFLCSFLTCTETFAFINASGNGYCFLHGGLLLLDEWMQRRSEPEFRRWRVISCKTTPTLQPRIPRCFANARVQRFSSPWFKRLPLSWLSYVSFQLNHSNDMWFNAVGHPAPQRLWTTFIAPANTESWG